MAINAPMGQASATAEMPPASVVRVYFDGSTPSSGLIWRVQPKAMYDPRRTFGVDAITPQLRYPVSEKASSL